ncbi:class I SAM-dependent methyltransferase [archaeon]|jgi:tRNA (uracil-5-)-methyltransferase TRM9|nr:class I SAM-dependent methyltransferase [archaeon]
MENQEKVWDNIAEEWHEYKKMPPLNVVNFLKEHSGKILDIGSGSGRNLAKIKNGIMYELDFSKEMLKLAEEKSKEEKIPAEFIYSKSNKLPFEDESFDAAICVSALHCVETPKERKETVEEMYRVLKKGGEAFIGVWNHKSKRLRNSPRDKLIKWRDKGIRYYYLYEEDEVKNLFKEAGFEIIPNYNSEMMINFIVKKPVQ